MSTDTDPPGTVAGWRPVDLDTLVAALDLDDVGDGRWQAWVANPSWPIFPGSQLLGSSVVALERAFPGYGVRTFSASFSRPGRADEVETVEVRPLHVGRSSASAEVAWSHSGGTHCAGVAILTPADAPDVVRHHTLTDVGTPPVEGRDEPPSTPMPWVPFEIRPLPVTDEDVALARVRTWLRCPGLPSPDEDPTVHRALLAHSSELFPFGALARALRESGSTQAYGFSVVGHAFTVHEPVDLRGWHLLAASVPQAGQGVATASTRTYAADGRLVLSVEQLGLTRSAGS